MSSSVSAHANRSSPLNCCELLSSSYGILRSASLFVVPLLKCGYPFSGLEKQTWMEKKYETDRYKGWGKVISQYFINLLMVENCSSKTVVEILVHILNHTVPGNKVLQKTFKSMFS